MKVSVKIPNKKVEQFLTKKEKATLQRLHQLPDEYQRRFMIWLKSALINRQRDFYTRSIVCQGA